MASILKRPLDLLIVIFLLFFLIIALTIDLAQSLYGSILSADTNGGVWPPLVVVKVYSWWCENYDPLTGTNPSWYESMAWFSPCIYAPFYVFAIYAFIFEKEWIRVPALMWGYGLLLTMFIITREQLYGKYAAPDPLMFALAYGSYIIVPILIMLRVGWPPVFPRKTHAD